ncbi:MAG: hypothetical protein SVX43_00885 [Cyanobacteriota bacterium]|nr:hypothetical protein [Cyanobacteriota bacterium]
MSKAKLSICFATGLALSSIVGLYPAEPGRTERLETTATIETASILSLDCVDADGKPSNNFEENDRGISVGRKFYRSLMRAYPGARMTCGLPQDEEPTRIPSALLLVFGLNDATAGTSPVSITAYVDGIDRAAQLVVPGQIQTVFLDNLEGAKSIALEVECAATTACNNWIYFTQAEVRYDRITVE